MTKIMTAYDPPPIPHRHYDWCAWDNDRGEDWGCGYGRTEEEAIAELRTLFDERDYGRDADAMRDDRDEQLRMEFEP